MVSHHLNHSSTYQLNFLGIKRFLPLQKISRQYKIANFSILGDIELNEKAGEKLEQILRQKKLLCDCFVGPEIKVVPFVHHMAKRFNQKCYVILRKSVRGYMVKPIIYEPLPSSPKHLKKLVLDGRLLPLIKDKKIIIVDDVVSTGATIEACEKLIQKAGGKIIAKAAIFKQGDYYQGDLIYLAKLPICNLTFKVS